MIIHEDDLENLIEDTSLLDYLFGDYKSGDVKPMINTDGDYQRMADIFNEDLYEEDAGV